MKLNGSLFTDFETSGEHSRGEIVSASVVMKVVTANGHFVGNHTIITFYGPDALPKAEAKLAHLHKLWGG